MIFPLGKSHFSTHLDEPCATDHLGFHLFLEIWITDHLRFHLIFLVWNHLPLHWSLRFHETTHLVSPCEGPEIISADGTDISWKSVEVNPMKKLTKKKENIKTADNKWYEFNDTNIKEIRENSVINSKSYCFFFRKKK